MSPTRRDLLRSIAGATVALSPVAALAHPAAVEADLPQAGWTTDDWIAWYARTMAESFPRCPVRCDRANAIDAPGASVILAIGEQESMVVLMHHGGPVDPQALGMALHGFMAVMAAA